MYQHATFPQAVAQTENCPVLEQCPVLVELRVVSEPETSPLPTAFAAPQGFIPETLIDSVVKSAGPSVSAGMISELKSGGFRAPQGFLP